MRVTVVTIPGSRFLRHGISKVVPRYDKCLNSGGEYSEKNSSTLAVFVPIDLSMKLDFFSVNGPRETYFLDALRILVMYVLRYY